MNFFHEAFAPNQRPAMQFCPVAKGPVSLEQSEEHPRDAIVKEHCSMLLDQLNYMNDAMQDYFEEEGMPSAKSYHSAVETLCRDLLATPSQTMEYGDTIESTDINDYTSTDINDYTIDDDSTGNDENSDYGTDDRAGTVDMDDDTKRSFLETISKIEQDFDLYLGSYDRNALSESLYGYVVSPAVEMQGSPSKCIPHIDTDNRVNYNVKLAELMCAEDFDCSGFNYYTDEEKTCFTNYGYTAEAVANPGVTHYAVEEPDTSSTDSGDYGDEYDYFY